MKKILFYIVAVLLLAYFVAAFVYSKSIDDNTLCKGIKVYIERYDSANFVTNAFISKELKNMGINPQGKKIPEVDLNDIENKFFEKDYVESVECYLLSDNSIMLDIMPIKPVMRVFENGKSFYINKTGKKIKSNQNFFIDLPVVTGKFTDKFPPQRLLPLLLYIEQNKELKSLVSLIDVKDSTNIFIIPNIANHIINLGSMENYESKFKKLDRMYKEVLPVKGWNFYDTISLKWDHQIVATRRKPGSRLNIAIADENDEEKPDNIETMTSGKTN